MHEQRDGSHSPMDKNVQAMKMASNAIDDNVCIMFMNIYSIFGIVVFILTRTK